MRQRVGGGESNHGKRGIPSRGGGGPEGLGARHREHGVDFLDVAGGGEEGRSRERRQDGGRGMMPMVGRVVVVIEEGEGRFEGLREASFGFDEIPYVIDERHDAGPFCSFLYWIWLSRGSRSMADWKGSHPGIHCQVR